jgi:long-subunit fatty acid transport protein
MCISTVRQQASISDVPNSTQRETKTTTGAQNQWSASYGVNIDDKFFFGLGLHLRSIRFENKSVYQESAFDFPEAPPTYDPINTVLLEEKLKITGSGFSATLGAIMRPMDGVQIGIGYNTPTAYTMSDVYSGRIATDWNDWDYDTGTEIITLDKFDYSTDEILSDYKLKTPGRLSVGGTYFFGKSGFVSGDAEFLNFVGAKYTSQMDGISYDGDNAHIRSLYRSGVNARIGGEYRLKDYRIRAGYNYMSDPLSENSDGVSRAINRISLGAGIRKEGYYIDVALVRSVGKNLYSPYSVPGNFTPQVDITANTTTFMFTVGLPFR